MGEKLVKAGFLATGKMPVSQDGGEGGDRLVSLNTLVCRTLVFKTLISLFMQPSKLDQILGLEIQRRRIEKRWSQEYLAEVTGLHRTYISQLERGLKSPSVRVLSHITNALDITMGEFLRVVEELLSADGKRD
ncbi:MULTISPECIES: helix-turn-helix domain-containing protein [unclassified Microcoleus]|uniref:helix-turn-helix domain-containing protein n=1 Tax=unclassified Microcoleus TaxID=2642155 RepID=UPI0025E4EE05|nr:MULTISPECIES: helix-turn-helix transcriptional regulator [unclassified Microcoleus]